MVTENVAVFEPCATVTDTGTLAAVEFELESDTTAPPEPAAEVRLTVPVADWPLTIVLGLTVMVLRVAWGGFTIRPKVSLTPA